MALTDIEKVRIELQDNAGPGLYILSDDEIQYFLDKYNGNIPRASMDAARAILFQLAQQGNERVDILSLDGSKTAEQYRLALQLYLRDPNLNPIANNLKAYFGNVSKSDIQSNIQNPDNNFVKSPSVECNTNPSDPFAF